MSKHRAGRVQRWADRVWEEATDEEIAASASFRETFRLIARRNPGLAIMALTSVVIIAACAVLLVAS